MFPPEAIQVLEHSSARVVILDPPYYSMGAWILFLAVCLGIAVAFLLYRGVLPAMSTMFSLVAVGLVILGLYLLTSKRVISLSRADGMLRIEKSTFGMSHTQATIPLDQIRKAIVENIHFNHLLMVVMKSGDAFALGDGSNRQGYFGAADAINDLLGPG